MIPRHVVYGVLHCKDRLPWGRFESEPMSILRALPLVLLTFALAACAARRRAHYAPSPHLGTRQGGVREAPRARSPPPSRAAEPAPSTVTESRAYEPDDDRAGLGTLYGERRRSGTSETRFERSSTRPEAVLSLWYDDFNGVSRSTDSPWRSSTLYDSGRNVSISLLDSRGRVLDALDVGHQRYAIGAPGEHYEIEVRNHSGQRYEIVASVDGLDVIDGGHASTRKRGYILEPYDTVVIEGWRTHEDEVAAFRFGRIRNSYAARRGASRDIGVIGVALFSERAPRWTPDRDRRRHARPFDDRFAPPPTW